MHRSFEIRCVAFVDILGFRDLIKRMDKEHHLFVTVRDTLESIDKQAKHFAEYRGKITRVRNETIRQGRISNIEATHFEMTAFSDCYVVSEKRSVWRVLAAVQALGSTLLEQGILSRGAIVHGRAYHKKRVVFGPAVIEAYELETQVAKYPRILVSDKVVQGAWGYHKGICEGRLFLQDLDGCWFLNVLAPPLSKWKALSHAGAANTAHVFLKSVRHQLQQQLRSAKDEPRKISKLRWVIHHFNNAARREPGVRVLEAASK